MTRKRPFCFPRKWLCTDVTSSLPKKNMRERLSKRYWNLLEVCCSQQPRLFSSPSVKCPIPLSYLSFNSLSSQVCLVTRTVGSVGFSHSVPPPVIPRQFDIFSCRVGRSLALCQTKVRYKSLDKIIEDRKSSNKKMLNPFLSFIKLEMSPHFNSVVVV